MIKGVNKTIIEINEYDSKMFEKAILFLKPNAKIYSSVGLKTEARKYLKNLEKNNKDILCLKTKKTKNRKKNGLIFCSLSLLIIGGLIAIISFII